MPSISIPGVTDKYNTSNTVERLMEVERIPLNREQETLKNYQSQQSAWRDINTKMSTLRDSVRSLYSFDSPFQSKTAESSNENAITAEAGRTADYGSFSIDVVKLATADRFLSAELDTDMKVDAGTYVFKSGEKSVSIKWNGGKLQDFVNSINRRGDKTFRANIINSGNSKKVLLIESLKTGAENALTFEKDALEFVKKIGMLGSSEDITETFGTEKSDLLETPASNVQEQTGMPALSEGKISGDGIDLKPRTSVSIKVPESVKGKSNAQITFSFTVSKTEDITDNINARDPSPILPDAGSGEFSQIEIPNFPSDTTFPVTNALAEPLDKIETDSIFYAVMADGSEKEITVSEIVLDENNEVTVNLSDYPEIEAIAVRNRNTGNAVLVSPFTATVRKTKDGLVPLNAVSTADDAVIKYEGITMTRATNKIDDVVPDITLNLNDVTERSATITVASDTETAKDSLITFVGHYNQVIAEINVLTQNRPELINELTYLTDNEREPLREKLGMFQSDTTLTGVKNSMMSIITAPYGGQENTGLRMLSQLGISSNASGVGGGYNASRLRGYLEIDEKTLDSALSENMEDIRKLFGFDSDGDMVIDSGVGYRLDRQIMAYTQSNGIISTRTSTLDTQIRTAEQRISRLETQLATREMQLKQQFGQMEGALNSMESQQSTIDNFMKQNSNSGR